MRIRRPSDRRDRPAAPNLIGLVAVLCAVMLALLFAPSLVAPFTGGRTDTVTRVYDGDTVQINGRTKVRLIGIDSLDSYEEKKLRRQAEDLGLTRAQVQRWAERAEQRARDLLAERQVRLEFGPERHDDYGRLLAYVHLRREEGELLINRLLLEEGLATATRRWPHPRQAEFIALEEAAHRAKLGLWKEAQRSP